MTREVVTATESDSLALAAELMSRGGYRHLPVVRGGQLVGLVSHCDVLRTLALLLRSALPNRDRRDRQRVAYGIAVGDVMVREVASVHPDTSAYLAAVILRGSARGCLPVVSGGCLVGIVTPSDFMGLVARALGCR